MKRPQHQIDEIIKCGQDPSYFIKKYVKIQHPAKGRLAFDLYDFQEDCLEQFINNRFNIVLKSRQLGLSTLTAAYTLWMALFQEDKNILVIATKLSVAQNFIEKIKTAVSYLPKWLLLTDYKYETKTLLHFTNGSKIKAVPTSPDAGRSEALSLCIVDECAIIRDFADIWTSLYSTLQTGGDAILISTPLGVGNKYHELCVGAENGTNSFNLIKLPWNVHPEHDDKWFAEETKNMSQRQIAQELMCDFNSSGNTFFNNTELDKISIGIRSPIQKDGPDYNLWHWDYYNPKHEYLISADVSRGDAGDFSAFHVFNTTKGIQVAEFLGKLPPDQLAILLAETGRRFGDATICVEQNALGYTVNLKLVENKYQNLYYTSEKSKFEAQYYGKNDISKIGFETTTETRSKILTKLEEVIRKDKVLFQSSRFYDQTKVFINKNGKPQAQKGKSDDLILSAAIGCWLFDAKEEHEVKPDESWRYTFPGFSTSRESSSLIPQVKNYVNTPNNSYNNSINGISNFNWLLDK